MSEDESISAIGNVVGRNALFLLFTWTIIFLCLMRGPQSIAKVYFTLSTAGKRRKEGTAIFRRIKNRLLEVCATNCMLSFFHRLCPLGWCIVVVFIELVRHCDLLVGMRS